MARTQLLHGTHIKPLNDSQEYTKAHNYKTHIRIITKITRTSLRKDEPPTKI